MNGVPQIDPTVPYILIVPVGMDGNVRLSTNITNKIMIKGTMAVGLDAIDKMFEQAQNPSIIAAPAALANQLR